MRLYLELKLVRFHKRQKWHLLDGWLDQQGVIHSYGSDRSAITACGKVGWSESTNSTMEYREFNLVPAPIRDDYLVFDLVDIAAKDMCQRCLGPFIGKDN